MASITLKPCGNNGKVVLEAFHEKRYTTVNDVTHDTDHIHDFYEIYVNLSGDVSFLVKDSLYSIAEGDVIVTAPHEVHRCIYHSDCIHEHFCIWIKDFSFAEEMPDIGQNHHICLPAENKKQLFALCFSLCEHLHKEEKNSFAALQSFYGILSTIFFCGKQNAEVTELPESFSRIVDYITRHYAEPTCTVAALCENFYISKSTLCRHFRNHFQTTPSEYIESKRFSEAKKLLWAGVSVQDVCFGSGFSDCSYFILRFRKKFGITPYRYQKESREE